MPKKVLSTRPLSTSVRMCVCVCVRVQADVVQQLVGGCPTLKSARRKPNT